MEELIELLDLTLEHLIFHFQHAILETRTLHHMSLRVVGSLPITPTWKTTQRTAQITVTCHLLFGFWIDPKLQDTRIQTVLSDGRDRLIRRLGRVAHQTVLQHRMRTGEEFSAQRETNCKTNQPRVPFELEGLTHDILAPSVVSITLRLLIHLHLRHHRGLKLHAAVICVNLTCFFDHHSTAKIHQNIFSRSEQRCSRRLRCRNDLRKQHAADGLNQKQQRKKIHTVILTVGCSHK